MLRPRWYLVQINHTITNELKMKSETIGYYHVFFLCKNPSETFRCDDKSR